MNNLEKYNRVFKEVFSLDDAFDGETIKMNDTEDWDSIGHITLITTLEDTFDIMFETEDILAFDTYVKGMDILKKYDIEM